MGKGTLMVVLNPDSKVKSTVIDRTTVFDQYPGIEKWGIKKGSFPSCRLPWDTERVEEGGKKMRHGQTFFNELRLMHLEIELHNCQCSPSKQQQNTEEIQT